MTEQPSQPVQSKRLLLYSILTIAILAAVSIGYFLFTFDLNNYRENAEEELSSLLSLPVTLGEIGYKLHDTNLALHIEGFQLGDSSSKLQVETEKVLVTLRWRGLLERKFEFVKISLRQPQILIKTTTDTFTEDSNRSQQASQEIDQEFLQIFSIAALEVIDGTLVVESTETREEKQRFEFSEFNAEVTDIQLNETFLFDIRGQLTLPTQKSKSLCKLQGEGGLRLDDSQELKPYFDFDLDVENLELESLREAFAKQTNEDVITGASDLHLHLVGAPSEEIDFQISLSSNNMTIRPNSDYAHPVPLKNLMASGRLHLRGEHPGIGNLSFQVDDSRLAGEISWTPQSEPFSATVTILNGSLPIPAIKRWLPDHQEDLQQVRQHLKDQGSAEIRQAQILFQKKLGQSQKWQLEKFKGTLLNIGWTIQNGPDGELDSLSFGINGDKWHIDNGMGKIGSTQLTIAGAGDFGEEKRVLLTLDMNGKIQPEAFLEEWQLRQDLLQVSGEIEVKGHLEGPLDRLNLDLQADLSQLSIKHSSGLEFPPGAEDQLALHSTITPQKISLDHGSLTWSSLKGHVSGSYRQEELDSLAIDALLTVNDLARVTDSLPLLKKLKLHGQADLSISQRGRPQDNLPEVTLTLRDAGLQATRFIADLSHINGRIKLTDTGMIAKDLQVHLGKSPLKVQAQVIDFSEPRLLLEAKAKAIHANDLIFRSERALLRDVDGHLEIDRDGLVFAPVDVRLDGGTNASVQGTISFHPPYDVLLDITSDFANVGEIVGLWTDYTTRPNERLEVEDKGTQETNRVTIKAQAKSGNLYGMSFHDATATITPTRERLIIHPLHFSVGEGSCDAQVITDFATIDQPTMLRVSGHAEDVDALEVYRELLNQQNILRGKLDGDFFINGEVGANYLPSSYGNFSILVHDGVLHEFPVLSKIFSLLNVSQLFALKLPDMDREGMPFNKLTANFKLDKGVLGTENLKIESEAMNQSYVGELNLVNKRGDFSVAIHPLGTVDKIVSSVPVAGWLLTGEDKALLTAHFSVEGKIGDFSVNAMPLDTLSEPTIGLLRRVIGLPFKLFKDPQILWGGDGTRNIPEEQ
jgi:uncharacterized protein involved in outer membrane biogenesis